MLLYKINILFKVTAAMAARIMALSERMRRLAGCFAAFFFMHVDDGVVFEFMSFDSEFIKHH